MVAAWGEDTKRGCIKGQITELTFIMKIVVVFRFADIDYEDIKPKSRGVT